MRCGADDRQAPLLVGVEPGQVQVREDARREGEVAEHDVLDARAHERAAVGDARVRVFVDQVQHDRDVVCAEAPEGVLVGPQLAEVQPARVDVVERAELARAQDLAAGARPPGGTRAGARPSAFCAASSAATITASASSVFVASGFSTKQCLPARATRTASSAWVGTGVASTTAVELLVGQQLLELAGRAGLREQAGDAPPGVLASGRRASAARSRRSRQGCGRGSGPSIRGRRRPP